MAEESIELSRLFISAQETSEPEEVSANGEFPKWLKGSFYQTGPGLLDLSKLTLNNYLDGYAMLTKFEIDGQTVKLTKKYPLTESYTKALENGKPYFMEYGTTAKREGSKAGFFSKIVTTFSRDDMSDNCSASIYQCGGHLIAASAASFIWKINPTTLCSEERFDSKKRLGQNGYGVHPLIDKDTGTMWNMGFSVLPTVKYNIIKIPQSNSEATPMDPLLSKASTVASISPRWSGGLAFNHSFAMSKNYIVFVEQPYVIKISRVLSATIKDYAVKDWLEWREADRNRFFIIEKTTGKVFATEYMSKKSFFFLHVVNCYEEGNSIVMDISTSETPSSTSATTLADLRNNKIEKVDPSVIERFIIPIIENVKAIPENSNLIQSSTNSRAEALRKGSTIVLCPDTLFSRGAERAVINGKFLGRKHSFIYATGSFLSLRHSVDAPMAHSICKINATTKETKIWSASSNHFPGESIFIPNSKDTTSDEDEGVLLAAVSSCKESEKDFLVVIDGKSFKEIARAEFDNQVPIGMHGIFIHK